MLHRYFGQFLEYCRLADFSSRSIQALTARLNEFKAFLKSQKIRSIKKVTYQHLIDFDEKESSLRLTFNYFQSDLLDPFSEFPVFNDLSFHSLDCTAG